MSFSVTDLVARVREYADARDDGDDPYISDAAIITWLNQENRRLIRRTSRLGYAWGETSASFTQSVVISDIVAVTGVYEVSGTRYLAVPRLEDGSPYDSTGRFWRVTKSATGSITVTVGQSGTYEIRYIPSPATLVASGATPPTTQASVYYPAGWEEILVLGAALRAKAKEGSDGESPLLRQLYEDEWDDIEVEAANADTRTVVRNGDRANPVGLSPNVGMYDWWWL